jgi:thioredoxin reductase/bacterioferritin-associated ferredoxin
MRHEQDLIVIGAGPAGISAAITASRHGLKVTLIDDSSIAGGQIYRATPKEWTRNASTPGDQDLDDGNVLRDLLSKSNVVHLTNHVVWAVAPGFEVRAVSDTKEIKLSAKQLIICSGVTERILPFPGWTTPGVIGLAASTNLLKSQQILPGENPVIAGSGPLLYAVADAIIVAGGKPAAIADLGSLVDWIVSLPKLLTAPALLFRGLLWRARIFKARIPVLHRHHVARVHGEDQVETIELMPINANGTPLLKKKSIKFKSTSLIVGHGLIPSVEISRLLKAKHLYRAKRGGWIPEIDAFQRTKISGLYVAGDCGGISGAKTAALSGTIAGLRASFDSDMISQKTFQDLYHLTERKKNKAERFGKQMGKLMSIRSGLLEGLTPDTIVCRCEDITYGQIMGAIKAGAADCNEVKAWTRAGMGPCQGRTCGETIAEILSRQVGDRDKAGFFTARVPLRPCTIDALAPICSYDEIWNSDVAKVATAILPAENTKYKNHQK